MNPKTIKQPAQQIAEAAEPVPSAFPIKAIVYPGGNVTARASRLTASFEKVIDVAALITKPEAQKLREAQREAERIHAIVSRFSSRNVVAEAKRKKTEVFSGALSGKNITQEALEKLEQATDETKKQARYQKRVAREAFTAHHNLTVKPLILGILKRLAAEAGKIVAETTAGLRAVSERFQVPYHETELELALHNRLDGLKGLVKGLEEGHHSGFSTPKSLLAGLGSFDFSA